MCLLYTCPVYIITKKALKSFYPYPIHAPNDVLAHPQAVARAMATPLEKVAIVVFLAELKSVTDFGVVSELNIDVSSQHVKTSGFGTRN